MGFVLIFNCMGEFKLLLKAMSRIADTAMHNGP